MLNLNIHVKIKHLPRIPCSQKLLIDALTFAAKEPNILPKLLNDLLTDTEKGNLTKRIEIAQKIYDGTPYSHISWMVSTSPKAIARISRKLADKSSGLSRIVRRLKLQNDYYHY
jgi:uncharacterized protein YerC